MSAAIVLFVVGFALIAAAGIAVWRDFLGSGIGAAVLGFLCLIVGLVIGMNKEADACRAKGGHMVPHGAPYYIKSGDVMVPFQPERCEVPQP